MLGRAILWLATSRAGRIAGGVAAALAALGLALLKAFSVGKQAGRTAQDRQALDSLRDRARVDDQVKRMPHGDRANRLKEWSPRE